MCSAVKEEGETGVLVDTDSCPGDRQFSGGGDTGRKEEAKEGVASAGLAAGMARTGGGEVAQGKEAEVGGVRGSAKGAEEEEDEAVTVACSIEETRKGS